MGQAPSSQAGMGTPYTHPWSSRCPLRASALLVQPLVKRAKVNRAKSNPAARRFQSPETFLEIHPAAGAVHPGCASPVVVLGRNAAAIRMSLFCKSIFRTFQCQKSRRANAKCISPSSGSSGAAGAIEFHSFHLYYKYCIVVSFFSLILSLEKNYKTLVDWSL